MRDLGEARAFYGGLLGCPEGRSSDEWVDFDFFGHQIVAHLSPNESGYKGHNSDVDGEAVPVRHFGAILPMELWRKLAARLGAHGVDFLLAPAIRFEGQPGEQAAFIFRDPSGNAIEFKAFHDESAIFAR